MKKPTIVTGSGRSGTHWLGGIMEMVHGEGCGAHEPVEWEKITDVVVDCRLRGVAHRARKNGHRVLHLVRDGRDVVRSLHQWYNGRKTMEHCCEEWLRNVRVMGDIPFIRLEDLVKKGDPSPSHLMPHWTRWPTDMTEKFWELCGREMEKFGYGDTMDDYRVRLEHGAL